MNGITRMRMVFGLLVAGALNGFGAGLNDIDAVLKGCVDAGDVAGVVSVITAPDYSMRIDTAGYADLERKIPMRPDTVFAMFSSSKSVCASAAMILVGDGKLRLDDPVSRFVPEFAGIRVAVTNAEGKTERLVPPKRPVTMADLLSHLSGARLRPKLTHRDYSLEEAGRMLAREPLAAHPGETFSYNNAAIDVAGRVIEVAAGMPYERFLEERIFKPLGMNDTTFFPNADQISRLAKCYNGDRMPLKDQTVGHDDARSEDRYHCPLQNRLPVAWKVYPAPSAGLYSTPLDFARYSQMLAHHGEWQGKVIIPRKIFDEVYAVRQYEWKPEMFYAYGNWITGEWFGHSGAQKTDQRVNLRTGHSRCFFTQIAPPGGVGFEHAKEAWNAAVDAVQCAEGATPCRDGSTPNLMPDK